MLLNVEVTIAGHENDRLRERLLLLLLDGMELLLLLKLVETELLLLELDKLEVEEMELLVMLEM